ncbi:MAG: DUF4405 domain-containing protein [Chlorobiaceae bacterium]
MKLTLKSWTTPLAAGAFAILAITGILIFFDIEIGIIEDVHKWLSWVLVGGVLLHIIANWKQFTGYFSQKIALTLIGTAVLIIIGSLLPIFGENDEEEEKERPGIIASKALEISSLNTIALVVKSSPQLLVDKLAKDGIIVTDPSLTIQEIASNNRKKAKEVLSNLLVQSKSSKAKKGDHD